MNITGTLVGVESVQARLESAPERVLADLRAEVIALTAELYGKIRDEYLSGRALNVRTGEARASVRKSLRTGRWSITGTVGASDPALQIWEAAREHVLRYKERERTSTKGPMWWPGAGHPTMTVQQHARQMAARPSFGPALSEMAVRIVERLGPLAAEVI